MRLDIFNIDFLSRFIQEQIPQSFSFLMFLDDNFIISHRCTHHRLCNQISSHAVWNHSILPSYSMAIPNQPHRLMSFHFGEISPRFGACKNIVRKFEFIFEGSKFLHDKVFFQWGNLADPQILVQILLQTWLSSRRLRSTSMRRRFLYRFQGKEWCRT